VSGQKAPDQDSMTYKLWRGQRRKAQSEWTEGPRSGFNDLHAVEEGNLRVSGQKAPDQKSMTYML